MVCSLNHSAGALIEKVPFLRLESDRGYMLLLHAVMRFIFGLDLSVWGIPMSPHLKSFHILSIKLFKFRFMFEIALTALGSDVCLKLLWWRLLKISLMIF